MPGIKAECHQCGKRLKNTRCLTTRVALKDFQFDKTVITCLDCVVLLGGEEAAIKKAEQWVVSEYKRNHFN
ncbi:MAG: hypothetical protein HRU19_29530 [Pseudobacteriovorax sp.]|nr:hypothetical protein [Pseudobacteriovorax sp.]